jgi:hypothetical protein
LKELNPSLEGTFERNLRNFRELEQLLEEKVEGLRTQILVQHGDDMYILPLMPLKNYRRSACCFLNFCSLSDS